MCYIITYIKNEWVDGVADALVLSIEEARVRETCTGTPGPFVRYRRHRAGSIHR